VIFHHFDRFLAEYDFHPHLHHLVTEGGVDAAAASPVLMNMSAGVFHEIPRMDDSGRAGRRVRLNFRSIKSA